MVEEVIPFTPNFTRESLLMRLLTSKLWMKQNGELSRVETSFNIERDKPTLTIIVSTSGDNDSSRHEEK